MFTGKKEYVTEVQVPLGHINMQAIILQAEVRILSEAMQIQGLLLIFIVYAMDGNIRYIRDTEFYVTIKRLCQWKLYKKNCIIFPKWKETIIKTYSISYSTFIILQGERLNREGHYMKYVGVCQVSASANMFILVSLVLFCSCNSF